jgi:hypothetical protein
MANFDNGVKGYISAKCDVKVFFPVSWEGKMDVCCYQCKMFSRSTGLCQITKEISEYPHKYIGSHCPLEFDDEIVDSRRQE